MSSERASFTPRTEIGRALPGEDDVVASSDRISDRLEAGKARSIESSRRPILHGGIELFGFDLAHGVGRAVVARELDARSEPLAHVPLRSRAGENADPALSLGAAPLEVVPRADVAVRAGEKLQAVHVVGNRGLHRLETRGEPFVAVQHDVALARAEELRHPVPGTLEERRFEAEVPGQPGCELDLEPDDAARIVVRGVDVRTASLLVPCPKRAAPARGCRTTATPRHARRRTGRRR